MRKPLIILILFGVGLALAFGLEGAGPGAAVPVGPELDFVARRIVATAPSVVESLYAIGAGEHVVGVGDYCTWPPDAARKPRVGGDVNPNFERIMALAPDLIVVQGRAENMAAFCRKFGIRLLRVEMFDLASIYSGLRRLGAVTDREAEADRLAARLRLGLAEVAARVAGLPRPRVFIALGHRAGSLRLVGSAGGKTFLSQLVEVAGGENVLADLSEPYPQVSKETLLRRRPEVILEFFPGRKPDAAERQALMDDWRSLPSLPAVRDGRIYFLTDDYLLLPGPRVVESARRLAEVLHPEAMKREDGYAP